MSESSKKAPLPSTSGSSDNCTTQSQSSCKCDKISYRCNVCNAGHTDWIFSKASSMTDTMRDASTCVNLFMVTNSTTHTQPHKKLNSASPQGPLSHTLRRESSLPLTINVLPVQVQCTCFGKGQQQWSDDSAGCSLAIS